MKILLAIEILFLLITSGCGRLGHDPAVRPYVDAFVSAAQAHQREVHPEIVSIGFEDGLLENRGELGICLGAFVILDRAKWESYDDDRRSLLLFHELGHCVLGKGHSNEKRDIMSGQGLPFQTWRNDPEVLDRFFH